MSLRGANEWIAIGGKRGRTPLPSTEYLVYSALENCYALAWYDEDGDWYDDAHPLMAEPLLWAPTHYRELVPPEVVE